MKYAVGKWCVFSMLLFSAVVFGQETAEEADPAVTVVEDDAASAEEVKVVDPAETLVEVEQDATAESAEEEKPKTTDQLLRELLLQLQQRNVRDPFAPDDSIRNEQKRANNEFVEVGPGVDVPMIELVGVVCMQTKDDSKEGSSETKVASIRIDGKIYFVREKDRLTLSRSKGNLVVEIQTIEGGSVEVKLGTLSESVIVR